MPSEPEVIVVGAGLAGLTVAAELGRHVPVLIFDRLPAYGGVLGYEQSLIRQLADDCANRHVSIEPGTTAARWDGERLLSAGPKGIRWTAANHLVIASGNRPGTQAELGIAGERLAGVFPASVAIHLAEAGVRLGTRVVIVGAGDWADHAIAALDDRRTHLIAISPSDDRPRCRVDQWRVGWRPVRVDGKSRVERLSVTKGGENDVIACDAVILAAAARPLRNVDGAILAGSKNATFVQMAEDRQTAEEVVADARLASSEILARGGAAV